MKRLKLVPIALVAALSACHQNGVGVDSGASQKAVIGAENSLRSDRGIQQHTAAAASIQMPAAPIMINSLTSLVKPVAAPKVGVSGIDVANARTLGLLPIAASAHPWQGWPFNCFGCAKEATWARGMARQVIYTNAILTQLYPSLGTQALADPAAARAAVQAAWKKLPPSTILAAWQQAGEQIKGNGINFDFTFSGPAPIHFLIGASDFQAGPTGWLWKQNGVAWFGDGAISGKQFDLSLESAIDKSQSQTSGTSTNISSSTEQSSGGSAGVK